ncbi:MAG: OFA family MFS transporter [Lachnospiraceae bacterium]|nr:OFA family MFS transporter [Lachnospiraceae bacterium]
MNRNKGLIIAEGIAANFLLGFLFIWTVMRKPLLELFPTWTDGMLSIIFGLHNLFICLGILIAGRLAKRFSGRIMYTAFAIMGFVGLGGFALLPENNPGLAYAMAFILFCLVAATGFGFGIGTVQSHTIPWFPESSGKVSGLLYMALGLSSVILSIISGAILPVLGVKLTMLVFGSMVLIISVIILMDKESICLPPTEVAADDGAVLTGITTKEMLRSPLFWTLLIWNIGTRTAGLIMLDHVAGLSIAYGGITIVGMLVSPCNGLGCITMGTILDKIGTKKVMIITALTMLLATGILISGHFAYSFPVILVGILLSGYAYGSCNSTLPAMIKTSFGAKFYTENFAMSNIAIGIAAFIESASGHVLESYGYQGVMAMMMCITLPSVVCAFAAKTK